MRHFHLLFSYGRLTRPQPWPQVASPERTKMFKPRSSDNFIIIIFSSDEIKKICRFYLSFSIFLLSAAMSRGCSSLSGDVTSLNIVTASSANSQLKCDQNALTHLYICVVEVEEAQHRSGLTAGKRKFRGMTQACLADTNQIRSAELCLALVSSLGMQMWTIVDVEYFVPGKCLWSMESYRMNLVFYWEDHLLSRIKPLRKAWLSNCIAKVGNTRLD